MHRSSGFSANSGNPFANLLGAGAAPRAASAKSAAAAKKAPAASGAAATGGDDAEAALERKRAKNREKRRKKKLQQQAAAGGNGKVNGHASDDEDEEGSSEDEDGAAAAANGVAPAAVTNGKAENGTARRKLQWSDQQEAQEASSSSSEEEEEEDDEEEEETAAASSSSEEEEEASDDDEDESEEEEADDSDASTVAAQVTALGHDAALVSTALAQLQSSGIPVTTEMLLLAVQQEEALANERRTGKHTVFKPKPKQPQQQQQPAKGAAATAAAKQPAPAKQAAAAKQPAANKAAAPAAATPPASARAGKGRAADTSAAPANGASRPSSAAAAASPTSATVPASAAPVSAAATPAVAAAVSPAAPRDDHTVAGLERLARQWNPVAAGTTSAEASSLLDEWVTLLEKASGSLLPLSAQRNYVPDATAAAFARSFHQSEAFEILVRRLLSDVFVSTGDAARARSLENPLLRLFTQCIPASRKPADLKFMLDSLRNLARMLEKPSDPTGATPAASTNASNNTRLQLTEQIIKVVRAARDLGAVHRQIDAALAADSKVASTIIAAAQPSAAVEAAAVAELSKNGIDAALFFGTDTQGTAQQSVKSLYLRSQAVAAALQEGEGVLASFASVLSQAPQPSLQMTFHLLEKGVQDQMLRASNALAQHSGLRSVADTQLEALRNNRQRELAVHVSASRDQSARESELLKRKAELLNELDNVNRSLEVVARAREQTAKAQKAIEDQFARNAATLAEMQTETGKRAAALQQDAQAAAAIHHLIVGSFERLSGSNNARIQRLVDANSSATTRYLQQIAQYLLQQASLVAFLTRRVAFCRSKLDALAGERAEAARFGVALPGVGANSADTERSLRQMVNQDTKVAGARVAACNALLRRIVKQAMTQMEHERAGAAAPIPAQQLQQLFATLLRTLETDEEQAAASAFDLSGLRDLVTRLGAVVSGAAAAAAAAAGAGADVAASAASAPVAAPVVAQEPVAAAAAAVDPFIAAVGKPRKSIAEQRKEAEQRKQQQKPQPQQQQQEQQPNSPPGEMVPASARLRQKQGKGAKQANGAAKPNGAAPAAQAAASSPSPAPAAAPQAAARPLTTPSPPARSWAAPAASAASSASAAASVAVDTLEDAFPALSAAVLNKANREEKLAAKATKAPVGKVPAANAAAAPAALAAVDSAAPAATEAASASSGTAEAAAPAASVPVASDEAKQE